MTEFQPNDIVRVELPRGYSTRGVLGISLMFSTSVEAKFEGAIGTITQINPTGPQGVHQYLVDFRTHDNGRVGIPWQAHWFREEWLALRERPNTPATPLAKTAAANATWPTKAESATSVLDAPPSVAEATPGIAHPEAKLFTDGIRDFAPGGSETQSDETIAHLSNSMPTGIDPVDDRSGAQQVAFDPQLAGAEADSGELIVEQGEGFVRVKNMSVCPDGFPVKGDANSGIFHTVTDASYVKTVPEICFASEDIAVAKGFRAPKNRG
jgi:hypothetical protein